MTIRSEDDFIQELQMARALLKPADDDKGVEPVVEVSRERNDLCDYTLPYASMPKYLGTRWA